VKEEKIKKILQKDDIVRAIPRDGEAKLEFLKNGRRPSK